MHRSSYYRQRPKTGIINLSDFMRIQNEIIPSKNNEKNRKDHDSKLKTMSRFHISNFPEVAKKSQAEIEKENYIKSEIRRRQLDEIESQYNNKEKEKVIKKANQNIFHGQDDIKTFNSQLLLADVLKEREFQQQINNQKKNMEKNLNERYYQKQLEQMEEYDRNEMIKKENQRQKKMEQMQVIRDQMQEHKIKRAQEYQEKEVEGILMKKSIKDGIEEDKRKEREIEKNKQAQKAQFIKANEDLQKLKKERRIKEMNDERKIKEFAIEKEKLEDMKKRVAKEKFDEKQAKRQKIIDEQVENLMKIKQKEEKILYKQIKEAEEKKEKEEEIKRNKIMKLKKEMEENRAAKRKQNEEEKLTRKKEEKEFVDNWNKRMKQLDQDEKMEKQEVRNRNVELAKYQLMQMEEKKKRAKEDFERNIGSSYQTKQILQDERDDYFEYVSGWIKEYQRQGKDITPLLLEIQRYKKRNNIE